jgi:predicted dehydrogenase
MHRDHSILCLSAGKAVLCEKPFAVNAAEARAVVEVARQRRVFLMEAMWTRFLPAIVQVRQWLAAGAIGEPRLVTADFGFRAGIDPAGRLFSPSLAGGALLDVGVYPISLACMVFGPYPDRLASLAALGQTGVDEQAGVVLGYPGGRLAVATTAIRTSTPQEARILGTEGMILIDPAFWRAERAVLRAGSREEVAAAPLVGNGYNYEAAEVGRCLRAGQLESPDMTLQDTVAIMEVLDRIRAQWGLRYPME